MNWYLLEQYKKVKNINSYESETLALLNRMASVPNHYGQIALNEFVKEGKESGWYSNADIIRVLGFNSESDALLNIKATSFTATKQGTPQFVPKLGFIGSAGNYLRSGYTFRTSNVNLKPDDACILVWNNKTDTSISGKIIGAATQDASYSDSMWISPDNNNNKLSAGLTGDAVSSVTDWYETYIKAGGLQGFSNVGGVHKIIKNGLVKKSASYTPGYFPTQEMYEMAGRYRGSVYNWLGDYSFMYCGASLTESQHLSIYNATKKLLTKLSVSWNKPSVKVPVYIIAGQSNCGRSQAANIAADKLKYKGALSGVNIYNPGYYQNSVWNQANIGVNSKLLNAANADEFGLEASLGYELQAYKAKDIYIFKHGFGGSSLAVNWNVTNAGNELFKSFKANLREALKTIIINGNVPDLKSIIWMQGENDAVVTAYASAYLQNITDFFTAVNNELISIYSDLNLDFVPNPKKVIGKLSVSRWGSVVPAAQQSFVDNSANNAIAIDTTQYTLLADNIHFDAASQIQFGIDIFNQIKDL